MSVLSNKTSYQVNNLAITAWAEADRPREKLILKGAHQLSDAELIAILLGSGSSRESAVSLAKRMLQSVDHNLQRLGKLSRTELQAFHGIGEAKAVTLLAAMELGRRRQLTPLPDRPQLRSSQEAYQCLAPILAELEHEECWMLCLNRANYLIQRVCISSGGRAGTVVDAKLVFGRALELKASSIILAHNHPSTNLQPSQADKELTKKLYQAGQQLDLPLLDHLIITEQGYFSFADEGQMS
ncbi:MAG: DNA repair protein RadC [Bacteroidota bacterium]